MDKVFCAGFGQLNQRVAQICALAGNSIACARRSAANKTLAFEQYQCDLSASLWPDTQADIVVVALSAQHRSVEAYRQTYVDSLLWLNKSIPHWAKTPKRVIVVSSTRVYGQTNGERVDDRTLAATSDEYGQILLAMERLTAQLSCESTVVRLSGIYGPGRDWMSRMALNATQETLADNSWTNRIHIDDAAKAITFLMGQPSLAAHYLISDTQPVKRVDMYNYFRKNAGVELLGDQNLPVLGKQVQPTQLKNLGFQWQYPTAFSGGYKLTQQ